MAGLLSGVRSQDLRASVPRFHCGLVGAADLPAAGSRKRSRVVAIEGDLLFSAVAYENRRHHNPTVAGIDEEIHRPARGHRVGSRTTEPFLQKSFAPTVDEADHDFARTFDDDAPELNPVSLNFQDCPAGAGNRWRGYRRRGKKEHLFFFGAGKQQPQRRKAGGWIVDRGSASVPINTAHLLHRDLAHRDRAEAQKLEHLGKELSHARNVLIDLLSATSCNVMLPSAIALSSASAGL